MSRRDLSVIIVPHDRERSRTIETSYRRLKIVGGLLVIVVAGIVVALVHYSLLLRRMGEMEELRAENLALRKRTALMDELNLRLKGYETYVERINTLLGVSIKDTGGSYGEEETEVSPAARKEKEAIAANKEKALFVISLEREIPSEWPLTRRGFVTRGYVWDSSYHPGIDIAVPVNTPVRATASGLVVDQGWDNIYGNYVKLRHGEGYTTVYSHNSRVIVREGEWVRNGDIIAFSGNTGRSNAPHLHYEGWIKGIPVDPQPFLLGNRKESCSGDVGETEKGDSIVEEG